MQTWASLDHEMWSYAQKTGCDLLRKDSPLMSGSHQTQALGREHHFFSENKKML